jgi:hypothetical protein
MNEDDAPTLPCLTIKIIDAANRSRFRDSVLDADWPVPRRVRALTTLRCPAGESRGQFASLNLGARCGDDAMAVARNHLEAGTHILVAGRLASGEGPRVAAEVR